MESFTQTAEHQALLKHFKTLSSAHMRDLFAEDPQRFEAFSLHAASIFLDYSKHRITQETLSLLFALARKLQLSDKITALFNGAIVNTTEHRAALHTALRAPYEENKPLSGLIHQQLYKMRNLCERIHQSSFRSILHIGIGGSDLGPTLVYEALSAYHHPNIHCHFVANIDGNDLSSTLKKLNPDETVLIIASKSFSTLETLKNANTAIAWLNQDKPRWQQVYAVSAFPEKATALGIPEKNIFTIWDWVGGRYSLWSSISIAVAIGIGMENFLALLKGANEMDEHFKHAPLESNMPVITALISFWYNQYFKSPTRAILPYDHRLKSMPAYLRQLFMESNGKNTSLDGKRLDHPSCPIIWGEVGCNGQHSFHQLLHQGTHLIPSDFIIAQQADHGLDDHQAILLANCLSQSQALMLGKNLAQSQQECLAQGMDEKKAAMLAPYKTLPGNQPSNTLLIKKLGPHQLGALLAFYEHQVYVESCLCQINPFDQYGVELGKQLSQTILQQLSGQPHSLPTDASTQGLLRLLLDEHALE